MVTWPEQTHRVLGGLRLGQRDTRRKKEGLRKVPSLFNLRNMQSRVSWSIPPVFFGVITFLSQLLTPKVLLVQEQLRWTHQLKAIFPLKLKSQKWCHRHLDRASPVIASAECFKYSKREGGVDKQQLEHCAPILQVEEQLAGSVYSQSLLNSACLCTTM